MQNVELNLPFTNKKSGGKQERLEWEKVAAEGSKNLKVITLQFLSHQTVNLGATWFKQQLGDFKQLNLEQDGQCSKKGKANRQGEG